MSLGASSGGDAYLRLPPTPISRMLPSREHHSFGRQLSSPASRAYLSAKSVRARELVGRKILGAGNVRRDWWPCWSHRQIVRTFWISGQIGRWVINRRYRWLSQGQSLLTFLLGWEHTVHFFICIVDFRSAVITSLVGCKSDTRPSGYAIIYYPYLRIKFKEWACQLQLRKHNEFVFVPDSLDERN